ncbi:unnamed protein product [Prorocentrum cordatum]|uniref:Cation/H+ exchanger transmembrane domain-containing protein n=1 Tax=Prorocentrum cordatum TaxID=2364126 RepID=A0ABN9T3W8_9DINO|nr:unnamed protein product [Polarella glacialis]
MGGDSAFMSMLRIAGFLTAAWSATKISKIIVIGGSPLSSIVLEITTGVVLGPEILGLIPPAYSLCEAKRYIDCTEPPGFAEGYGTLTDDLQYGIEEGYCDPHDYVHSEHAGSVRVSFTAVGVMYRRLAASGAPEAALAEALQAHAEAHYLSTGGHRRLEAAPDAHAGADGMEGAVTITLGDFMGHAHVDMVMACPDVDACKSSLTHAMEDGSFQASFKGVIEGLSFIGYVADVSSIEVMGVSADWMPGVFTPLFMNTTTPENRTGFITSNSSGLYYQAGVARHYVDNSSTRPWDGDGYLEGCYTDPMFLTDEEMLVLPVGENWYGCAFISGSERLLAEEEDLLADGVPAEVTGLAQSARSWPPSSDLAAPAPRRLSGGGSYHSFGECLTKECDAHRSSECQLYPDVFTLIGHTGVAMMIFESGMHFDFGMARQVGPWACVVATLGTFLPLISGMLLAMAYGFPASPAGLTAGTSLAPTSVGISLRLLGEAGVLALPFGQTIMTAAFVDDILSLVIFNIVFAVAAGDVTFMTTFFPSLMGVLFMLVAVILAVTVWPWALKNFLLPGAEWFKRRIDPPDPEDPPKISEKDQALFIIMMAMLIVYALITFLCGTHLWGCFIAGMSYACLDEEPGHAHHVWVKQTKRITSWMIRIFFSCTVAFSIPVAELLDPKAFLFGSIMGIGPCILTKVSCAFFMGPPKFVIGWAMVGRAEFAYLIAQMGKAGGMIDDALFSILIWALLWATIFAPLIFRLVLTKFIAEQGIVVASPKVKKDDHHGHSEPRDPGLLRDEEALQPSEVVGSHRQEHDGTSAKVGSGFPASEPQGSGGQQVASNEKAWEESAIVGSSGKTAEELPPCPTVGRSTVDKVGTPDGGRGFLCCIFFKKVTMV